MAATILTFPQAKDAHERASDRRIRRLAELVAVFAKGERVPATEEEQRIYELAMLLEARIAAARAKDQPA